MRLAGNEERPLGREGAPVNRVVRGALAGVIATLPMTLLILAARSAGLLRTPPPAEMADNLARRANVGEARRSPFFDAAWFAGHLGIGAACGAAFALARPVLPASRTVSGLAYGGTVWGLGYLGLMPALGLYPWPDEDSRSRIAVMIAAHAVYGLALAEADHRLPTS